MAERQLEKEWITRNLRRLTNLAQNDSFRNRASLASAPAIVTKPTKQPSYQNTKAGRAGEKPGKSGTDASKAARLLSAPS